MKQILLTIMMFSGLISGFAQGGDFPNTGEGIIGLARLRTTFNLGDMFGRPFQLDEYANIKGSPYNIDSFTTCLITLYNKKQILLPSAKLNLHTNEFLYLGKDSMVLSADEGLIKTAIFIKDSTSKVFEVYSSGYPSIGGYNNKTFYRQLNEGRILLLQHHAKAIRTQQLQTLNAPEREFRDVVEYYVYNSKTGLIASLRKSSAFLIEFMWDKQAEVKNYINSQKYKCKDLSEIMEVINFCNKMY